MVAAKKGFVDIVKLLLKYKPDVSSFEFYGKQSQPNISFLDSSLADEKGDLNARKEIKKLLMNYIKENTDKLLKNSNDSPIKSINNEIKIVSQLAPELNQISKKIMNSVSMKIEDSIHKITKNIKEELDERAKKYFNDVLKKYQTIIEKVIAKKLENIHSGTAKKIQKTPAKSLGFLSERKHIEYCNVSKAQSYYSSTSIKKEAPKVQKTDKIEELKIQDKKHVKTHSESSKNFEEMFKKLAESRNFQSNQIQNKVKEILQKYTGNV